MEYLSYLFYAVFLFLAVLGNEFFFTQPRPAPPAVIIVKEKPKKSGKIEYLI